MLKNLFGHLKTVVHHKWIVFQLCTKAGIPWRGFVHDISKFGITEFWMGVKYYNQGKKSPIEKEKKETGYSKAWLHHKGRNKHHPEYWYDENAPEQMPIIPFCYMCEMICDQLAAGKVYQGKNWTKESQLDYWSKRIDTFRLNPKLKEFTTIVLTKVAKEGIAPVIKKSILREIYDECIEDKIKQN